MYPCHNFCLWHKTCWWYFYMSTPRNDLCCFSWGTVLAFVHAVTSSLKKHHLLCKMCIKQQQKLYNEDKYPVTCVQFEHFVQIHLKASWETREIKLKTFLLYGGKLFTFFKHRSGKMVNVSMSARPNDLL